MMGGEAGRTGAFPAERSSLRAFWREPRVWVERYVVASLREEELKRGIWPGI